MNGMTAQKAIVDRYTEGFRRGDLAMILSCPTADVVWALHGGRTIFGREAFAEEAAMETGRRPTFTSIE